MFKSDFMDPKYSEELIFKSSCVENVQWILSLKKTVWKFNGTRNDDWIQKLIINKQ